MWEDLENKADTKWHAKHVVKWKFFKVKQLASIIDNR